MRPTVDSADAETHLSALLGRVQMGEEIVISKAGIPVALLTRIVPKRRRKPGGAEGLIVPDEFFSELPEEFNSHLG